MLPDPFAKPAATVQPPPRPPTPPNTALSFAASDASATAASPTASSSTSPIPHASSSKSPPDGWKTTSDPEVLFRTSLCTLPLAAPSSGPRPLAPGPLETLRGCLNIPSRAAWLRCLAWLLAALRTDAPYPILVLQGPPGSGKSFAARILRSLVDPSTSPLAPIPPAVRQLLTLARHNWVLAFDQVPTLSRRISDALCLVSSGLGAALGDTSGLRLEPLKLCYGRPVVLTVDERWSCAGDLARRSLTVALPPLADRRRPEDKLLSVIDRASPAILGALCSAVRAALYRTPRMNPPTGRCPDVLFWAMAASPALGSTDEEMRQAFDLAPQPHPIVEAIRRLLQERYRFVGSATELLELLRPAVPCPTPTALSHQIRKDVRILADLGIALNFRRISHGARIIELRRERGGASFPRSPKYAPPDFEPPLQPTENTGA